MSLTRSAWSDVRVAALAGAVSTCGDMLAATALVLALQDRGAGSGAVAAVMIAAALPPVLLARGAGRLVDRVDSRTLLAGVGAAQAVLCLVLAMLTNPVAIVVLVAALGAGLAVTRPTLSALLPAMVTAADLGRASAVTQTANSVGMLLAPALGGVLTGQFGLRVPLLVDAASYLAVVLAGLVIRTRRGGGRDDSGDAQAAPGARVRRDRLLWSAIALVGAVVAVLGTVNVANVFLVRDTLGASATVYGLLAATWLGSLMAGGWLLSGRTVSDGVAGRALLGAFGLTCLNIAATATVPSAAWMFPLFVVGGLANGVENVAIGLLIARRTQPHLRGRVFAYYGAIGNAGNVTGFLLGGILLAVLPVRVVVGASGLIALLITAAFAVPMLRTIARDPMSSRAVRSR